MGCNLREKELDISLNEAETMSTASIDRLEWFLAYKHGRSKKKQNIIVSTAQYWGTRWTMDRKSGYRVGGHDIARGVQGSISLFI